MSTAAGLRSNCSGSGSLSRVLVAAGAALTWLSSPASAQIQLGGELDVAYAHDILQDRGEPSSEINTTFKGKSPFSLIRVRLQAEAPVADGISAHSIVRYDEGRGEAEIEGAYVIFSGLANRPNLNLLVGKMAMAFGTFANRGHATRNPVIGVPLIYQHFTTVQGSRVPADATAQLALRETAPRPGRGLPVLYDACWNTGLQIYGSPGRLSYAVALTKGTVSNPGAASNDGAQLVGRLGYRPGMALDLGASAAVGSYLSSSASDSPGFPAGESVEGYYQLTTGIDASYVFGHWEFAAEVLRSSWEVPNMGEDLTLIGGYVEGSLAILPGYRLATRLGMMDFAEIGAGAGRATDWDYDVRRVETAIEYYISRNARLKFALQLNFRPDAADSEDHLIGIQLATAF